MFNYTNFDRMAITHQESIIDRLIRVSLRFNILPIWLKRIDRPSQRNRRGGSLCQLLQVEFFAYQ